MRRRHDDPRGTYGRDHREPARATSELGKKHNIDPFALFCAYHLGITAEDTYRFQNVHEVAKRFGTSAGVIRQVLSEYGMDPDTLVNSSFELASAQVDVMNVPEGVSRTALAKDLFEQFQRAPRRNRDWAREIEQDRKENERVFGTRAFVPPRRQ